MQETIFSTCCHTLGKKTWGRVLAAVEEDFRAEHLPDALVHLTACMDLPGYIADLARLEWMLYQKKVKCDDPKRPVEAITINPTLTILPVQWKNLAVLIQTRATGAPPYSGPAHVIIWQHPKTNQLHYREAGDIDLLALKLVAEQVDPTTAAALGNVTRADIQTAIDRAVFQGLLLSPGSSILRVPQTRAMVPPELESFLCAQIFTLQWHITQACDLHCKHCYDRSDRAALSVDKSLAILEDFYDFCRRMHVRGQVTFTGGNPLLYPHFEKVYRRTAQLGFGIAILGNPTPVEQIQRLIKIARPLYFQISLEGLAAHNDHIRGKGHFDRSLRFLQVLRELGIFNMVMLTLTRDNLDQVIPLAELLENRTDSFTFNRLSTVGEGAKLLMPEKNTFEFFLRAYDKAAVNSPIMGLKDNLFNIIRRENGDPALGGCTGYGCGAAFNFLALLPDGEVHACRKFPSIIGNVLDSSLYDIYHGHRAGKYRAGSQACRKCSLNLVCRGCLAVSHSLGLDVFTEKDPFCFVDPEPGSRVPAERRLDINPD